MRICHQSLIDNNIIKYKEKWLCDLKLLKVVL